MADGEDPNTQQTTETQTENTNPSGETQTGGTTENTEVRTETKPTPTDWKDREIARQRERRREQEARVQQLTQELEALKNNTTKPLSDPAPVQPNVEFDRLVNERARQFARELAATEDFNRRLNETAQKGKEQFPDTFNQRVAALKGQFDLTDPSVQLAWNNFMIAAMETGEAPRLIHDLGGDPEQASRIMGLPAVRMAVELAKMAGPSGTEVSRAPRPITPITQTSSNRSPIDPDDPERADQLSSAEWFRRREAQANERWKQRMGR